MTESDDPTPPDPKEPHHGLAEELREEIAEVVEHVPQPVRWTVGKLLWLTALIIVSTVVIAVVSVGLYLANRTEWVAQELTLFLNQTLALHSDIVLEIKDLRGNPLTGLRVIEPRVRFRDSSGPPLLEAKSMTLGYSAWQMLDSKRRFIEVAIDDPTIRLTRGADGKLRWPVWKNNNGNGKGGVEGQMHIVLNRLTLTSPEPEMHLEQAHVDATVHTAPLIVDVADLSWKGGPYGSPLEHFAGRYQNADSVTFAIRELRMPELRLAARGSWPNGGGDRRIHVDLARVRWKLLARVFDNHSFDVPGEGGAVVDAVGRKDWHGDFSAKADWDSLVGDGKGTFRWENDRLVLAPLVFQSNAGHLDGRLDWAHAGWSIGGEVRGGNPEHWSALHLKNWPSGDLNGRFRYDSDSRPHAPDHMSAQLIGSMLAGWRADSAAFVMDFPDVQADSFTVRMLRRGGVVLLHGRVTDRGWNGNYSAARFPLDEWPDGRASGIRGMLGEGAGLVDSHDGKLYVSGALAGTGVDWLGMHAAEWRLEHISGPLLDVPDMLAEAHLKDLMYLGIHFDSARAGLHLGDMAIGLDSVRAAAGDTVLTLAGRSTWGQDQWTLALDHTEVRSSQLNWTAEPPVLLHGVPSGVTFDRLEAHDSTAHFSVTGRWAGPHGEYDWRARGERLDLSRLGLPPEIGLSGSANATLVVTGAYGDPRWALTSTVHAPGQKGHAADSLQLDVAGAPARLEIHDARMRFHGGTLAARGTFERMARLWPDTLTADGVARWLEGAAAWQGTAEVTDFPIDRIGQLAPAADGWSGTLSGGATFRGSPAQPEFDAHAHLVKPGWKDYGADDFEVRARYAADRLEVTDASMTRAGVDSHAKGTMPLELALGKPPVVPEAPMHWDVEIPNGDLALMPIFVPQIGSASGHFKLKANIGGTPKKPDLEGNIEVRDGRVRLAARTEVLENVRADLHVDEARITLDSLSARQGQRGRVTAKGRVDLNGMAMKDYVFDLDMRDFSAAENGLYATEVDGKFQVTNGPRVNGQTLPMVVGSADLKRAVVLFDFTNQNETQQVAAATQPLFWTYRIHATAKSNLRWRPPEGEIEFAADLNLEQTRDSLIIFGDMQSLRGTYYFLSNRFTVDRANLTFDNVGAVNPTLDVEANTRILGTDANGKADVPHTVTVTITGRANAPIIALSDEASGATAWDQNEILRQLTFGASDPRQNPFATVGDPLNNYVSRAINRSLSADLSRAFGNYVNEWALERDRGGLFGAGNGAYILSAGSQINDKLRLNYSQRLPGLGGEQPETGTLTNTTLYERDVEAEYRINRFFYITSELAQRRTLTGVTNPNTGTPDFNINLKARWEY